MLRLCWIIIQKCEKNYYRKTLRYFNSTLIAVLQEVRRGKITQVKTIMQIERQGRQPQIHILWVRQHCNQIIITLGYQFRKKQNRRIFQDREAMTNNQRSKEDIKMTVNHVDLIRGPSTGTLVKPSSGEEDTPSSNVNRFGGTKEMVDSYFTAPVPVLAPVPVKAPAPVLAPIAAPDDTKVLMSTLSEISKKISQEKEELSKEWEKLKLSIKQEQEERERFKLIKEQELKEIESK